MHEINAYHIAEILITSLKAIKIKNKYYTDAGLNVFHARQWFDFREVGISPALSVFVIDESLLECKGNSFKQQLNIKVEGYIELHSIKTLYGLVSDIKRALLSRDYPFTLAYHGHEISLPEESSRVGSVQARFTITYVEQIMKGVNNG